MIFGIGIGLIMALVFSADDAAHDEAGGGMFAARGEGMGKSAGVFLVVWVVLLLAGTLKLDVLTGAWLHVDLPLAQARDWQAGLDRLVPFDAARGEEGVSLQGVVLILLLGPIWLSLTPAWQRRRLFCWPVNPCCCFQRIWSSTWSRVALSIWAPAPWSALRLRLAILSP